MTIDAVIAPELLSAEIEAIEDLLVHYEDWRALSQLEIRERQGEVPGGASTSGLKAMLIEKLATNPLFLRRQTLLKELERLTQSVHTPGQPITVRPSKTTDDDLTRIRGIDARLERRLNALNIRSFVQIAAFNLDDVRYVSNTLGLENRIISQMWIEQAEMLTGTSSRAIPVPEAFRPVDYAAGRMHTDASPLPQPVAVEPVPSAAPAPVPPPAEVPVAVAKPAAPTPQARAPQGPVAPEPRAVEEKAAKAAAAPPPPPPPKSVAETAPAEKSQPPSAEAVRTPTAETRVGSAAGKAGGTEDAEQAATPSLEAAKPVDGAASRAESRAKSEPQKLAAHVVDAPVASAPAVSESVAVAAAEASAPAVAEPLYGDLVPPRPMKASQFKTVEAEPAPVSSVQAKPAEAVVVLQDIDPAALKPASPLAAAKFAGAVLAPHHDYALPDAKPPPKPRPPAAYVSEEKAPQMASALPSPQAGKAASPAAQPQPPSATSRDSSAGNDRRASTLATENLPPLPLKPAVPVSPPPPLPRTQTAPPAGVQGASSAPPATPPSASASAAAAAAAAQAAAAAREAAMLAAAAARGSSTPPSGGARIPPPLPPAAVLWPESQPQQPHPRTAPVHPAGAIAEARELVNTNEASVTIRRLDDGTKGQPARGTGTMPVRAGRSERVEIENFDSSSYAAYHSEVEEASVQIVRRKEGPGTAPAAYVPPPPSQGVAPKPIPIAPERSAAKPLQPVPPDPKAAGKAAAPIGRFLRALTGQ